MKRPNSNRNNMNIKKSIGKIGLEEDIDKNIMEIYKETRLH